MNSPLAQRMIANGQHRKIVTIGVHCFEIDPTEDIVKLYLCRVAKEYSMVTTIFPSAQPVEVVSLKQPKAIVEMARNYGVPIALIFTVIPNLDAWMGNDEFMALAGDTMAITSEVATNRMEEALAMRSS
jgi:hypothetical protein